MSYLELRMENSPFSILSYILAHNIYPISILHSKFNMAYFEHELLRIKNREWSILHSELHIVMFNSALKHYNNIANSEWQMRLKLIY